MLSTAEKNPAGVATQKRATGSRQTDPTRIGMPVALA